MLIDPIYNFFVLLILCISLGAGQRILLGYFMNPCHNICFIIMKILLFLISVCIVIIFTLPLIPNIEYFIWLCIFLGIPFLF